MANTILKRVIGEAAFAERPDGSGRYADSKGEREIPSGGTVDLSTVGQVIGSAPPGRSYPELEADQFEKREVQIGREMLDAINLLPSMARNDVSMRKLAALAQELIDMHTPKSSA